MKACFHYLQRSHKLLMDERQSDNLQQCRDRRQGERTDYLRARPESVARARTSITRPHRLRLAQTVAAQARADHIPMRAARVVGIPVGPDLGGRGPEGRTQGGRSPFRDGRRWRDLL